MRIAIFGAGGSGGYLGGRLAQAGEEVVLIARGEHMQAIRDHGLKVDSIKGNFVVAPSLTTSDPKEVGFVDAVILVRLFEGLFSRGIVVVATSNRPPNDLYKNGLRRDKFLPFIDLICERLDIHQLHSVTDYRLERMLGMQVYHHPVNQIAEKSLDFYFSELAG